MEPTNEQYSQISRYVDGDMNEMEKAFFEAVLNRDENLLFEVKAYKEIQILCTSAGQKIKDHFEHEDEKKKNDNDVWKMIAKARKEWEQEHEGKDKDKNEEEIKEVVVLKRNKRKSGRRKIFGQRNWSRLAAAIVIGIACFVGLWYLQKKPGLPTIAKQQNQQNSQPEILTPKGSEAMVSHAQFSGSSAQNNKQPVQTAIVKPFNTKKLFAAYFKPDAAPDAKEALLEEPFNFYVAKNYNDAIETFEMAQALDTRGEKSIEPNTGFYITWRKAYGCRQKLQ